MKKFTFILSLLFGSAAFAENCIVQKYKANAEGDVYMVPTESQIVSLVYDSTNQEQAGDTFISKKKIKGDMSIVRMSHFEDGAPEIQVMDDKTGTVIASSKSTGIADQGGMVIKSPTNPAFAYLAFTKKDITYHIVCE